MSQQKINYVFSAVLVVLALILGYFGMTLPVQPEIPSPLPTPDVSGLATYEDLALLQRQVETLGAQSFTVSGDDSYSTDCYQKQGGSEWIADDGCTWGVLDGGTLEVQSGATLDVQSGATVNLPSVSAGNTTITGNLAVSGTTNLVGNVSSSVGAVTVTDGLVVTGVLDAQGTIINSGGTLTINDHLDVVNTLNYGTANLYPIGSEDSNFQFSWGSQTITGTSTALVNQKVGQPTAAWCTIGQTPGATTAQKCSTVIVGTTVTVSVWLTGSTPSATGVDVDWLVIGVP